MSKICEKTANNNNFFKDMMQEACQCVIVHSLIFVNNEDADK